MVPSALAPPYGAPQVVARPSVSPRAFCRDDERRTERRILHHGLIGPSGSCPTSEKGWVVRMVGFVGLLSLPSERVGQEPEGTVPRGACKYISPRVGPFNLSPASKTKVLGGLFERVL